MRINIKQIKKDVQRVYDNKAKNEKVEMLFTVVYNEIVFAGHSWNWNSFYTIDDLKKMNCFKVMLNCNEEFYAIGARIILSQEELAWLDVIPVM